jgi:hypothetical protein
MSANHAPMHGDGCPRCADRRRRLAAYTDRMTFRHSPAGQKALAKLHLQLLARDWAYKNRPAEGFHDHRQGRRHRIASNGPRMARRALRVLMRSLHARATRPTQPKHRNGGQP